MALCKKDFYRSEKHVMVKGKKYPVVSTTDNCVTIRDELGVKQGFNKESDFIQLL